MSSADAQLLIVPVLLPLVAGALLLVIERVRPRWQGRVSTTATLLLAATALALARVADADEILVYLVGNWAAPFGIVLVLDRLSAVMLVLVAALSVGSSLAATGPFVARGPHFAAFFQFQLAGLNGAFLTGDLFNLFVFFEVLLIASYALLLHGASGPTLREGLRYVVINLVGSTLFLVGASLVYGAAGTLNLADLARRLPGLPEPSLALAQAALLLLFAVFALKAAVLPFGFWLPSMYSRLEAPVAALFAIMTKVGVYAIVRLATTVFGGGTDPFFAQVLMPVAVTLGVLTVVYGASVALASTGLAGAVAGLVAVSSGSLIVVFAVSPADLSGVLYYLTHSTLVASALFLLAGAIARARGSRGDRIAGPRLGDRAVLGLGFFAAAIAVAGLPPLSGFVGKVQMMEAVRESAQAGIVWTVLLASGLAATVALARAGSTIFWKTRPEGDAAGTGRSPPGEGAAIAWLLLLLAALALGAGPASRFAQGAAAQLAGPSAYIDAVMGTAPVQRPAARR